MKFFTKSFFFKEFESISEIIRFEKNDKIFHFYDNKQTQNIIIALSI